MIPALMGLIGVACTSVLALGVVTYQPAELGVRFWDSAAAADQAETLLPEAENLPGAVEMAISGFEIARGSTDALAGALEPGDNLSKPAGGRAASPPKAGRVYRVTAYCDRGWTASGTRVGVGQCAAPVDIPFGSRINVPALGRTFVVTDRTDYRFRRNTVDIFMPDEAKCWRFGRKYLECHVVPPASATRRPASR
jgi:3D (Asp-Asp-Asp) domain-containing protein